MNGERIEAAEVARELRDARAGEQDGEGRLPDAQLRRRALDELVDAAPCSCRRPAPAGWRSSRSGWSARFRRSAPSTRGTHLDELLRAERLSEADLAARLRDRLTIERLFETQVFPGVRVADDEVLRHYTEHAAEQDEPARVHALQIVVATREAAAEVRARLRKNPRAFAEVARASSIAPEGKEGGDLGFIARGAGYPEVFDACFALPLNAISDVIPSPYGFHVFKVVEKKPARRRTLEEARAGIAEKLGRERRARAQAEYVEALRRRASIQIDEQALAAVTP